MNCSYKIYNTLKLKPRIKINKCYKLQEDITSLNPYFVTIKILNCHITLPANVYEDEIRT